MSNPNPVSYFPAQKSLSEKTGGGLVARGVPKKAESPVGLVPREPVCKVLK
jgi:hypothetical protein